MNHIDKENASYFLPRLNRSFNLFDQKHTRARARVPPSPYRPLKFGQKGNREVIYGSGYSAVSFSLFSHNINGT